MLMEEASKGNIISAFLKSWTQYCTMSKLLERIFGFLDRFYLKNAKLDFLGVSAMKIFKNVCYVAIQDKLIEAVLRAFKLDRNGTAADYNQIGRVIKCYVGMGMNEPKPHLMPGVGEFVWIGVKNLSFYTEEFETPLLRATQ